MDNTSEETCDCIQAIDLPWKVKPKSSQDNGHPQPVVFAVSSKHQTIMVGRPVLHFRRENIDTRGTA